MFKKYLIIFIISMIPLIELRGAIPVALAPEAAEVTLLGLHLHGLGLPILWSYVVCIIANMLPVPIIYWFALKVIKWGQSKKIPLFSKFCNFCMEKGEKGGRKLQEKAGRGLYIALFLFVGIPLPGTGAWTGTLAASILEMDFKKSIIAVMCGVVLAGIIMGCGTGAVTWIASLFN